MTAVVRVGCQCGAMTFCVTTAVLPHACAFCSRSLPARSAARLRALRVGRGLTTRAVATYLGIGRTTVYEWEAARRPIPTERRGALAVLLQVPADLLAAAPPATAHREEPQMSPELIPDRTPPSDSLSTADHALLPPAPARPTVCFTIELGCLLCGRDLGVLESSVWPTYRPVVLRRVGVPPVQVADWRRLHCDICAGAAIPTEVTRRLLRNEAPIDWTADRPRRGRPPKWLAARRANGSSAA